MRRALLLTALFLAGAAACAASLAVDRRLAELERTVAELEAELEAHQAAGGGLAVDGDPVGGALETQQVSHLAWRAELVMRLWALRVGGGVVMLGALAGLMAGILRGPPKRRSRRRRRRSRRRDP